MLYPWMHGDVPSFGRFVWNKNVNSLHMRGHALLGQGQKKIPIILLQTLPSSPPCLAPPAAQRSPAIPQEQEWSPKGWVGNGTSNAMFLVYPLSLTLHRAQVFKVSVCQFLVLKVLGNTLIMWDISSELQLTLKTATQFPYSTSQLR